MNLFNTRVSQFELNYWNKWTFPRHSNLLRCTCIYFRKISKKCQIKKIPSQESPNGAFPRHGTTRLGTAQYGTARHGSARFTFPLQISTTLEWVGLFTCRYSCATSTAVTPEKLFHSASLHQALAGSTPRLSMRRTSVLPQQTMKLLVVKKRCTHSKPLHSILRWLCWFKSSVPVVSHAASSMTQAVTIFSGQSVISRVYTSRFGNGLVRLEPQPRWYWKKYQVLYPVENPPKVNRTVPYHAVEKRYKRGIHFQKWN